MQVLDPEKQAHIQRMIESDPEFRRLHAEHHDIHRQIAELVKRRHWTPEEENRLAELKKRKLAAKDAMGRMLFEDDLRHR